MKCRWGGEEFLILLPETALQGTCRVAETLRHEIGDNPVPWADELVATAASFGVTQAIAGEINIAAIVGRADAALYRAKEDGRNRVRAATETVVVVEPQERAG